MAYVACLLYLLIKLGILARVSFLHSMIKLNMLAMASLLYPTMKPDLTNGFSSLSHDKVNLRILAMHNGFSLSHDEATDLTYGFSSLSHNEATDLTYGLSSLSHDEATDLT